MIDCSVMSGFYFAMGKALWGLCVLVGVMSVLLVVACIKVYLVDEIILRRRRKARK